MFSLKIYLNSKLNMRDDKVNYTSQKHQNRYFIDGVHRPDVEVGFTVRVFFTKKVGSYFREIK